MGAIAAHKVPERMADGTCTQGWVWMTNKCRKRMNRKEEYITTEISQEKGGVRKKMEAQKQEGGSCVTERGWRIPVLERGVPSPWDVGLPDSVCLSSPKQAVTSLKPNFWPHSLQIHCNELGPKTVTLQLYLFIYLFGFFFSSYTSGPQLEILGPPLVHMLLHRPYVSSY